MLFTQLKRRISEYFGRANLLLVITSFYQSGDPDEVVFVFVYVHLVFFTPSVIWQMLESVCLLLEFAWWLPLVLM